jgi:hypothetical protein
MAIIRTYKDGVLVHEEVIEDEEPAEEEEQGGE